MDIKTLTKIAGNLPAEIAVLMRGPTGIGKSHVAKAISEEAGLPFIDVCFSPRKSVHSIGSSKSSSNATFAISFASARIFCAEIPQTLATFSGSYSDAIYFLIIS